MAPTTPATSAAARAVAASPAATSEGNKVAARSVGLGLPALPPPLPGLGLASHGQPSFCNKRLARNVASMAAGQPSAPLAAANNEEIAEFVNALKQEWDGIENKYVATTVAVAITLGMWSAGAVVSAIDKIPVVPSVMEVVGIGYSGWFVFKNLLFKPDRDAFFKKVTEFYEDIISG